MLPVSDSTSACSPISMFWYFFVAGFQKATVACFTAPTPLRNPTTACFSAKEQSDALTSSSELRTTANRCLPLSPSRVLIFMSILLSFFRAPFGKLPAETTAARVPLERGTATSEAPWERVTEPLLRERGCPSATRDEGRAAAPRPDAAPAAFSSERSARGRKTRRP